MPSLAEELRSHYVLVVCEGTAGEVVFERLLNAGKLAVPQEHLVEDASTGKCLTRQRGADAIAERFLNKDYTLGGEDKLLIVRILDSRSENFRLKKLYQGMVEVRNVRTRPEVEMLAIHKLGAYDAWLAASAKDHNLRPSEFCKGELGLPCIKERAFLEKFWADADELVTAVRAYQRHLGKQKAGELCLADLLEDGATL